ncbi:MAG: hypothetical protein HZA00_07440 [Nitrospinae bacterium]|nr:hypothetical protein [Nitrospinota bacterium]
MKITPLQSNSNITESKRTEVSDTVKTDNIYSSFAAVDDTVVISQEARDLANNKRVIEKAHSENTNQNKNPEPKGNFLTIAKRYLDYYINNSKDLAIKVRDEETKKIIKEIPLKEEQKLRAAIEKIVDEMDKPAGQSSHL